MPLSARQKGYNHHWEKARAAYLREHPLCVMCQREKRVMSATVVDHIKPHKGDQTLFWDRDNWQPLCRWHHNRDKQRIDRGGKPRPVIGLDGWPVE